jgi:CHASE3 domain sensor protein
MAQNIEYQMIEASQRSLAYVISGVPEEKERFMQWTEKVTEYNESYRSTADLDDPDKNHKRELFNEITSQQKELIDNGLDIFKEYEQYGEVNINTFQDYKFLTDKLINLYNQLLSVERIEIDEHNQDALALIGHTYIKMIIIGLLIFLCIFAVIIYFSFYISHQKIMEEEIHHLHNYVSQLKSARKM